MSSAAPRKTRTTNNTASVMTNNGRRITARRSGEPESTDNSGVGAISKMSRLDRTLGLARSLAVYHGIPLRQRRMRGLYRAFVSPGDLVFDIGAHVGNRARAFAALGCRVVAVEPQPDLAAVLRRIFAGGSQVRVVEAAVSFAAGRSTLSLSDRRPTVATTSERWREARRSDPPFAGGG